MSIIKIKSKNSGLWEKFPLIKGSKGEKGPDGTDGWSATADYIKPISQLGE